MTPHIGSVLGEFYHRVARRLTDEQPWRGREYIWVYLLLEAAMSEVGLQEAKTYVYRRQNKAAQFIDIRTIVDLYLAVERRPGSRVTKPWWEQDGLDVEGMRTAAW